MTDEELAWISNWDTEVGWFKSDLRSTHPDDMVVFRDHLSSEWNDRCTEYDFPMLAIAEGRA